MRIFRPYRVCKLIRCDLFAYALLIFASLTSTSHSELTPRLAVLELQGDVGSLKQRQVWSDTVRAASLEALHGYQVSVIDRDQFLMLIQPGRDLSTCIGMCAAQIAREVGARWSLSGQLVDQKHSLSVTLKVHAASGDLLGVEQESIQREQLTKRLMFLTKSLILRTLIGDEEDEEERSVDDLDEELSVKHESGHDTKTAQQVTAQSEAEKTQREESTLSPTMIERQGKRICVGPLITQKVYRSCVEKGPCTASASWGKCQSKDDEPVVCINIQQALQFAKWSGGRLPSVKDWLALSKQSAAWVQARRSMGPSLSEWTLPVEYPEEQRLWSQRMSTLDTKDLRTENKVPVWQFAHGKALSRMVPPAFQTTQTSFRVVYPEIHCHGDGEVK